MNRDDGQLGKIAAQLIKTSPRMRSQIEGALQLALAKTIAAGGQDSTYGRDVLAPIPVPEKPKPESSSYKLGDKVVASGKAGTVIATVGELVLVQFDDNQTNLFKESDLSAYSAEKVMKSFVPRVDSRGGQDGTREWLDGLAKTIHKSSSPFKR